MAKILIKIILFFTPYVNLFEWKVDLFFKNIKSTDSIFSIKRKLLKLMQKDLIVVNIWMEKRYKGYLYLKKRTRGKMYENTKKIVEKFNSFCLHHASIKAPVEMSAANQEKIKYLALIAEFLKPGRHYNYIETTSFGKLLRDPNKEKLEGDCNQIVTLYIYLYSLKYNIEDLEIKLLPDHVCLHFQSIDIEATNATFTKYKEYEHILPATEIISTNLLDIHDFRENVQKISERTMLKSAQLAYAVSSLRTLVQKNLNIAYQNLGIAALNAKNYESAVFYLEKTENKEALAAAYKNAAIYYMNSGNYVKSRHYADKSKDPLFRDDIKKSIAGKKYNQLAKKVANIKTYEQAKHHRYTYQKMLELARETGNETLINNVREILNKI